MKWFKLPNSMGNFRGRGTAGKYLLTFSAFVLLTLAGAYLYLNASDRGVNIELDTADQTIFIGRPFEVEVRLTNNSQSKLNNVRLTLGLPPGVALLADGNKVNVVRDMGEVSIGGVAKEQFVLIPLPSDEENAYEVEITATYGAGSLSADFSSTERGRIAVEPRDFGLSLEIPDTVFVGQEFQARAVYSNTKDDEDGEPLETPRLLLVVDGGRGFDVIAGEPEPLEGGNNEWLLGEGRDREVFIKGRVSSKEHDVFNLKASVVLDFAGERYILRESEASALLAPSPLSFSIALEDARGFVLPGELLTYRISYRNNTEVDLKDVVIRAQLLGEMFDMSTLDTAANFNNLSNILTWSSSRFSQLRQVRRGDEGGFTFKVRARKNFPIDSVGDKNFTLKVESSIESPTITRDLTRDRTASADEIEVKVAGLLDVSAEAYFRDADSGILNQGPFPPRAGEPTHYTIHWVLTNFGTDVEGVVVKARLENGVEFTGVTRSNTGSLPEFNEGSREVVWRVGDLAAAAGVLSDRLEVIFQVRAAPSVSLLGQFAPLVSFTTVSAKDTFSGAELSDLDDPLTTELPDDPSVAPNEGRVANGN